MTFNINSGVYLYIKKTYIELISWEVDLVGVDFMGVDFVGGHRKRTILVDPNMWQLQPVVISFTLRRTSQSVGIIFFCKEYLLREV